MSDFLSSFASMDGRDVDVNSDLLFFKQLLMGGEGIRDTSGFDWTHIEQFSLLVSNRCFSLYGSKSTEHVRRGAGDSRGGVRGLFKTPSSRQTRAMYSGWMGV